MVLAPVAVTRKAPLLATLFEPDTNRIWLTAAPPVVADRRIVEPAGLVMVAPVCAVQTGVEQTWLSWSAEQTNVPVAKHWPSWPLSQVAAGCGLEQLLPSG